MARARRTLRERGQEALQKNNFEYALRLYLQYLANNPGDVEARKELRAAEIQRRKGRKASPLAGMLRGLFSIPSLIHLGLLKMLHKHEAIIRKCEKMLVNNPANLLRNVSLAEAAEQAGYPDVAIFSYRVALEQDPENEAVLRSLARAYREVEDISKAIETYQALLRVAPSDDEAKKAVRDLSAMKSMDGWSERERAEVSKETARPEGPMDLERATEALKEEFASRPEDRNVMLRMVDALTQEKDYSQAISVLKDFITKHGGDFELKSRVGELRLREYDSEISKLEQKLKDSPGNKTVEDRLNQMKRRHGSLAIEECRRKIEHYPTDLNLRFRLGELYYEAGQIDKAISQFQRTVKSGRFAAKSYEMMGLCFIRKRVHELAAEQFKKALATSKDSSIGETAKRLNYWLGRTHELMEDKKIAREFYLKVYEIDIEYRDVAKKMEELGVVHEESDSDLRMEES